MGLALLGFLLTCILFLLFSIRGDLERLFESKADPEKESYRDFSLAKACLNIRDYFRRKNAKNKEMESKEPATWALYKATLWLTLFTAALVGTAIFQYFALTRQQSIMQGQLDEMQAEQRPWLRVSIKRLDDLQIDKDNVSFGFDYTLLNTGKSPIKVAFPSFEMVPGLGDKKFHDSLCQTSDAFVSLSKDNVLANRTIFPQDDDVNLAWRENIAYDKEKFRVGFPPDRNDDKTSGFATQIYGCIAYKSTSNDTIRHTRISYNIWKTLDGKLIPLASPQMIEAARIRLGTSPTGRTDSD